MDLTFKIPRELEEEVRRVSEAELSLVILKLLRSELARRTHLLEARKRVEKIVAKSKFTEKDADELSEKVKASMHAHLKADGLL